jgi:hypothetical protein
MIFIHLTVKRTHEDAAGKTSNARKGVRNGFMSLWFTSCL